MNWEMISSVLRHILTFGGGFIVAKGWIDAEALPGIVGAIITVGGAIWALFNKTEVSLVAQAANIEGTTVVTTPEIAEAVPSSFAVSSADVKVVSK